jgi:hypothetical protein
MFDGERPNFFTKPNLAPFVRLAGIRITDSKRDAVVVTWDSPFPQTSPIELEPGEDGVEIVGGDQWRVYLRTTSRILLADRDSPVRTVFRSNRWITGVALSGDASEIWVAEKNGIHYARTGTFDFELRSSFDATCLAVTGPGRGSVWACADQKSSGFVIANSIDGGRTFVPKLRLCEVAGVLTCPSSSTTAQRCSSEWEKLRSELVCTDGVNNDRTATRQPSPPAPAHTANRDQVGFVDDVDYGPEASCSAIRSPHPATAGSILGGIALAGLALRRRR